MRKITLNANDSHLLNGPTTDTKLLTGLAPRVIPLYYVKRFAVTTQGVAEIQRPNGRLT